MEWNRMAGRLVLASAVGVLTLLGHEGSHRVLLESAAAALLAFWIAYEARRAYLSHASRPGRDGGTPARR